MKIKSFIIKHSIFFGAAAIVLATIIGFAGFLGFHFMYDDWGMVWMAKNDLPRYIRFVSLWPGGSHPALLFSFFPWVYLFGTNPIYYNIFGLGLKIASSFCFGYFFYTLTHSKKYFFISGVLYGSSFIGLEAFSITATRNIPYVIILLLLCMAFYIRTVRDKSLKFFIISMVLLLLASISDPVRVLPFPFVLLGIEVCLKWKNIFDRKVFLKLLIVAVVTAIGFMSSGVARQAIFNKTGGVGTFGSTIKKSITSNEMLGNLSQSLGSMASVYLSTNPGYDGLDPLLVHDPRNFGLVSLFAFSFVIVLLGIKYRKKVFLPTVFFAAVILMYLPDWFFSYYSVDGYHRYLAISGVFFLAFLLYVIYIINNKFLTIIFVSFILLSNFIKSFQISRSEATFRDYNLVEKMYGDQEKVVPNGVTRALFMYEGPNILVGNQMVWSAGGTIPFSFKRNITEFQKMPSFTSDYGQAAKMVCPGVKVRSVINDWIPDIVPIPLSSVFGWRINEFGQTMDITDIVRARVADASSCLHNDVDKEILNGIKLVSVSAIPSEKAGDTIINLHWKIEKFSPGKKFVDVVVYQNGKFISSEKVGLPDIQNITDYDAPIKISGTKVENLRLNIAGFCLNVN